MNKYLIRVEFNKGPTKPDVKGFNKRMFEASYFRFIQDGANGVMRLPRGNYVIKTADTMEAICDSLHAMIKETGHEGSIIVVPAHKMVTRFLQPAKQKAKHLVRVGPANSHATP